MIDALYPIMGGMISKYVTQAIKEMMETINKKIESGLSFESYKRKAKAKLTGVSETELLMEESSDAIISSMFVIHKDTSLLIAEAHLKDKEIDDAHMVASMASAIKDFINDWIKSNESSNEVQILSYGDATLYIESAGSVYVVAFLDAEPDASIRMDINTFFASVMKEYSDFFQKFDGDDSADEIVTLSMKMEDYLLSQNIVEKKEKKNPAKYFIYLFIIGALGYGLYLFNAWYIHYSLEQTVYAQTGEKISIHKKNDTLVLEGQVASTERIYEIVKLIKRRNKLPLDNHLLVPMVYLDERIKSENSNGKDYTRNVDKKFELLERNIEQSMNGLKDENVRLQAQLDLSKKYLVSLVENKTAELSELKDEKKSLQKILEVKKELGERLDSAFKGNAFYNAKENALDFGRLKLFEAGTAVYKKEAIVTLAKTFEKYMLLLTEYKEYINVIVIEGHSDSSGLENDNIILSKKRALAVKYFVERLSVVKQYHMTPFLRAKGLGSSQAIVSSEGIEDQEESRRIKVKFELSDEKIVKRLRGILHD